MLKRTNKRQGFSLIELVVIIAIVAVLAAILVPSLLTYTERSRAQKDVTTMDEVVNSVQLAMSDSNCYDEMIKYSCENNFITYTDSSGKYGQQIVDAEYWAPDGSGKATTITFNPEKDSNGNTIYRLENAIVNDMTFGNGSVANARPMEGALIENNQCYLKNARLSPSSETGYLYNKIKATVGTDIITTSATYANSSFTIFIRFSQKDSVTVADVSGAFNGTNLNESSYASLGSNTQTYEDNDLDKPISENKDGGTTKMEITGSALQGSGSITPDYKGGSPLIDNNDSNDQIVEDKEFIPMQNGQEYIVLDGTRSMSFILTPEDGVDICYNGNTVASIPSACVAKSNPTMTLSGTGTEYDGTYEFFNDGYVERDGMIVAKAKERWLNVDESTYIIMHKGNVYGSYDGNHADLLLDKDTLQATLLTINDIVDSTGGVGKLNEAYPYTFSKYDTTMTVKTVFDLLEMMTVQEYQTAIMWWGEYVYYGGLAQDTVTGDAMLSTVKWNDVEGKIYKSIYEVNQSGKKKMTITSPISGNIIIELVETEDYYFKGEKKPVFFVEDFPFAYDEGMTYAEWMNSRYRGNSDFTHPFSAGAGAYVYIPIEYVHRPCSEPVPAYSTQILHLYNLTYTDGIDYYDMLYCNGEFSPEWYDTTSSQIWNSNAYKYQGYWYGVGQPVRDKIISYELYTYFLNNNKFGQSYDRLQYSTVVYPAFQSNSNSIDISSCIVNGTLDREKLEQEFGIPSTVHADHVKKEGNNIILLQSHSYPTNYSGKDFWNLTDGYILFYNGDAYEGWEN